MSESNDEKRFSCRILAAEPVTHDVRRFVIEKPDGYSFRPGQATELCIDDDDWRDEKRPLTFTSLNDNPHLEFTVKIYEDHDGVTAQLGRLGVGDRLEIGEAWGAITYRGPGTFIAGGAGVTPFIAILRQLEKDDGLDGNRLLFSNRTAADIILHGEFTRMLGDNAVYTLTREKGEHPYHAGRIDGDFLQRQKVDFDRPVYLCGPPEMMTDLSEVLKRHGVDPDKLVIEA